MRLQNQFEQIPVLIGKPFQTRRLKFLAQMHPDLLQNLEDAGLIFAHTWNSEATEIPAQADSEEADIFP